ncbi:unnamed protein product [Meloidogyne enterolobii]|uniref:Uncharacterized protein n=1 Tax=Meloidogyne enterolobii TaxID=390850 RepID=A0ACB1A7X2_MELEN
MELLNAEYDAKTMIKNMYFNKKDVKNPKEFFQTLFNKWINLTKNNNFGLLMASPYNKIGGHIQTIVVAVGTGKGEEEEKIKAKQIFKGGPNTFCRPPFVYNCSDNSLFCYLCKKSRIIENLERLYSSEEDIRFNIESTNFDITLVHKLETRIVPNDSNWIKLTKEENSKDSFQNYKLAQFKTFAYLENLIKNRDEKEQEIFNQAFIYLKRWAEGLPL